MHDRTADKIARVTSRIPRSAATIIPFDVTARIDDPEDAGQRHRPPHGTLSPSGEPASDSPASARDNPDQIAAPSGRERRVVTGRVRTIRIKPVGQSSILACTITDHSGELTALFYGRTHIPGIGPGTILRLSGRVSVSTTGPIMVNPAYELTDSAP
jgi:hypothetical protein